MGMKISPILKYEEFIKWVQDVEELRKKQEEQIQLERKRFAEKFNKYYGEKISTVRQEKPR